MYLFLTNFFATTYKLPSYRVYFPNHKALCSMHYSSYIEMAANINHVYLYGVLERGKKFWVNLYKKQRIWTGLSSEKM